MAVLATSTATRIEYWLGAADDTPACQSPFAESPIRVWPPSSRITTKTKIMPRNRLTKKSSDREAGEAVTTNGVIGLLLKGCFHCSANLNCTIDPLCNDQ